MIKGCGCLLLVIVLVLTGLTIAAYNDVEPFVTVKDNIENWMQDIFSSEPNGYYTVVFFGESIGEAYFHGDTLELTDPFLGKKVYTYEIINGGTTIKLTNVVTQDIETMTYNYLSAFDIVVLDGVEWHKK